MYEPVLQTYIKIRYTLLGMVSTTLIQKCRTLKSLNGGHSSPGHNVITVMDIINFELNTYVLWHNLITIIVLSVVLGFYFKMGRPDPTLAARVFFTPRYEVIWPQTLST